MLPTKPRTSKFRSLSKKSKHTSIHTTRKSKHFLYINNQEKQVRNAIALENNIPNIKVSNEKPAEIILQPIIGTSVCESIMMSTSKEANPFEEPKPKEIESKIIEFLVPVRMEQSMAKKKECVLH